MTSKIIPLFIAHFSKARQLFPTRFSFPTKKRLPVSPQISVLFKVISNRTPLILITRRLMFKHSLPCGGFGTAAKRNIGSRGSFASRGRNICLNNPSLRVDQYFHDNRSLIVRSCILGLGQTAYQPPTSQIVIAITGRTRQCTGLDRSLRRPFLFSFCRNTVGPFPLFNASAHKSSTCEVSGSG